METTEVKKTNKKGYNRKNNKSKKVLTSPIVLEEQLSKEVNNTELENRVKELELLLETRTAEVAHQSKSLKNQSDKINKLKEEVQQVGIQIATAKGEIVKLDLSNQSYKSANTKARKEIETLQESKRSIEITKNSLRKEITSILESKKLLILQKDALISERDNLLLQRDNLKEELVKTDRKLSETEQKLNSKKVMQHVHNFLAARKLK